MRSKPKLKIRVLEEKLTFKGYTATVVSATSKPTELLTQLLYAHSGINLVFPNAAIMYASAAVCGIYS